MLSERNLSQRATSRLSHLYEISKIVKSIDTRYRLVIVRGRSTGEHKLSINGPEFLLGMVEMLCNYLIARVA